MGAFPDFAIAPWRDFLQGLNKSFTFLLFIQETLRMLSGSITKSGSKIDLFWFVTIFTISHNTLFIFHVSRAFFFYKLAVSLFKGNQLTISHQRRGMPAQFSVCSWLRESELETWKTSSRLSEKSVDFIEVIFSYNPASLCGDIVS